MLCYSCDVKIIWGTDARIVIREGQEMAGKETGFHLACATDAAFSEVLAAAKVTYGIEEPTP